eukprot:13142090-Ditylum_brightwellii.AAC.1
MGKTVEMIEEELSKTLPWQFVIAFDGWSEFGVHYLGGFAVGPGVPNRAGDLSAKQHEEYLKALLAYFNRNLEALTLICGDNCSENCKISDDLDIPLIGCHSHHLNLAIQHYLALQYVDDTGNRLDNHTIEQKD